MPLETNETPAPTKQIEPLALIKALASAAKGYRSAVDLMNQAMKDGINVQGALSALCGYEDILTHAIAEAELVIAESPSADQDLPGFVTAARLNSELEYAVLSENFPGPQTRDHIDTVWKSLKAWDVVAGKIEWDDGKIEHNVKTCHTGLTFEEALALYAECADYHFRRIEFAGVALQVN